MSLVPPLRIQVVSDLHVDVATTALRLAAGAEALVVAGDTCEGLGRAFAWLRAAVPMPTPILAVAGKHEHYRGMLPEALAAAPALAAAAGVTFLEDGDAVVSGVRFLGCTLWTDYALDGEPWRPLVIQAARAWLEVSLAAAFDGPTVVITHHAPSRLSLAPSRLSLAPAPPWTSTPASSRAPRGTGLDPCYASNLDGLVAAGGAALWIHGHTHRPCDYAIGATRVLDDGRGYGGENAGTYDHALVVEVAR